MDEALDNQGKVVIGNEIAFDHVPILSPNGDVLVNEMSF